MSTNDSINIHTPLSIDVDALPSSPSSPSWESPTLIYTSTTTGPVQPITFLGKKLKELSLSLYLLIHNNPSVADLEAFLERWKVSGPMNLNKTIIHRLILEWFQHVHALRRAIENQRIDLVRVLFRYGFRVESDDMQVLMMKVEETGNREMLELVLKEGQWDINAPISRIRPPILGSVAYDDDLVRWLLSLGADPNGMSLHTSFTVLQSAVHAATVPSLVLLLGAGGDISSTSGSADIVAYAACSHTETNNRIHVIKYLLEQGADVDLMMGSAKKRKENERDRDECAEYGCEMLAWRRKNALHWAIERGMCDLVQLLLERGADTSVKTWSLLTGMRWLGVEELAEKCGKEDVVEVLNLFMGNK